MLYTENDDGYGYRSGVICDTELGRELTIAALERDIAQRERRRAEDLKAAGKPAAESPQAEQLKAEQRAERQAERDLAVRARGANLDLGRKLLDQLAEAEFSSELAELLAYTILSRPVEGYWTEQAAGGAYSVAALAARGLRYVLPDWQQERQLKNGTTKVDYLGGGRQAESRDELEQRFWAWFETATTPEQIGGRLVIALAAAHWALDQCVPRSQRSWCSIYPGKDERALKALERLTRKALPASLKRLRKEITQPGS